MRSTLAAIRSSVTLRAGLNAVHAWAAFAFLAVRMHAFLTYCCARSDPPCTWRPDSVLKNARSVPCRSKAPWCQYL